MPRTSAGVSPSHSHHCRPNATKRVTPPAPRLRSSMIATRPTGRSRSGSPPGTGDAGPTSREQCAPCTNTAHRGAPEYHSQQARQTNTDRSRRPPPQEQFDNRHADHEQARRERRQGECGKVDGHGRCSPAPMNGSNRAAIRSRSCHDNRMVIRPTAHPPPVGLRAAPLAARDAARTIS